MVREELENDFGPKKMTKKSIQASCRKNKLYLTPHLNDVLYLHYSGYNAIECLEEYVGLKCLWLECNAISNISGLMHQPLLRCLYLHNNLIKKIENLEHCKQLDTLNLSHNHITKVENCGIDILPALNTLNLSHNYLKSIESVEDLRKCDFVSVLDISHNRIEDIAIVKVLGGMKGLRVLTLTGNPVVNEIPSYRKTLILECKSLTYLDSRPVFDKDRACAEAWKRGGYQEEQREHLRWKKEEQRKMRRNINATLRLRHRGDGEPELLKTSSDEDADPRKDESLESLDNLQYMSNEDAWKETEELFSKHPDGIIPTPSVSSCDKTTVAVEKEIINDKAKRSSGGPLVQEITQIEYNQLTAKKEPVDEPSMENETQEHKESAGMEAYSDDDAVPLEDPISPSHEKQLTSKEVHTPLTQEKAIQISQDIKVNDGSETRNESSTPVIVPGANPEVAESPANPKTMAKDPMDAQREKESKIATAEKEETLNVVIHSKEISITMQPTCSEPVKDIALDSVDTRDDPTGERKPSNASVDYVTGSDSNSDPTLVTDCDSCIRNSSVAYSSRSDTSDSEDMFDKIVPRKHRKLASIVRSGPPSGTSSTGSSDTDGECGALGSKLDRQNTITEFIDEYKRFFRSVDTRDPKCVVKNRHKLVRPGTAKAQRTEPIVYEGVLKAIDQHSNATQIEEARQEQATASSNKTTTKEESVFERLLKGHAAGDMNLDWQTISIGGRKLNFNEHRLEVFRKDQEKLQSLIDRVTARKEIYNARIDSIHDQLANIMDDYGQISEKLKKVDDMLQTIGEEVHGGEAPQETQPPEQSVVEQIVQNLTTETKAPVCELSTDEPQLSSDESYVSSFENALRFEEHEQTADGITGSCIEIEEGVHVETLPQRKSIPDEFRADPVYRKFIDIQHEIDKLTEDEIFHVLSEAARELHGDEEQETRVLQDAVDAYWAQCDDVDSFRRCLNLNSHPIIQRFKRFIECQCETDTDSEDREHVRKLEQAYQRYERRLSNHLFDEYLIMSRKVSIATTTGGESSAAELELIEMESDAGEGHVAGTSRKRRSNAWDIANESLEAPIVEDEPAECTTCPAKAEMDTPKLEELEDDESKPEQQEQGTPNEEAKNAGEVIERGVYLP